jgi:hypothetical protein
MTDAYPLHWPAGWPRIEYPLPAKFKTPFSYARDNLLRELKLPGTKDVVISTNMMIRQDGLLYAKQRVPEDRGTAVYFTLREQQRCIPCDKWSTVQDKLQAIRLTVEALRGLERWGAKEMVDSAFSGFKALPAGSSQSAATGWWTVLGLIPDVSRADAEDVYRLLVKTHMGARPGFGGGHAATGRQVGEHAYARRADRLETRYGPQTACCACDTG